MDKLSKKTLSVISLLIILGILLMPVLRNSSLVVLSILMCAIGGFSFGTLLSRK